MLNTGGRYQTDEFTRVADHLNSLNEGLLLIVGNRTEARPEIVISAGGIRDLFPLVMQVVDAAPEAVTARYDVRAFRPRVPNPRDMRIRLKGNEIGPVDIYWKAKQHRHDRTRCDLTLYVPGYIDALPANSTANQSVAEGVFVLLDHLVGEWAVEAQIGVIDWKAIGNTTGLATLDTLPDYLDTISAQ